MPPEKPIPGPDQSHRTRVDPRLLELLVCPVTKTSLYYDEKAQELVSRAAGLAFPIKDGVPLMALESARKLDDDEAVRA